MFTVKKETKRLIVLIISLFYMSGSLAQPVEVEVIYPKVEQSQDVLTLVGTVEAKQHSRLAPLQSGVVATLYVEEGDEVSKGAKLMALDAKLAELSLSQADASLKAAKAAKDEAERLYLEVTDLSERQLAAETLLAERQSAYAVANANLNQSKAEFEQQQEIVARHTLYAPFSGVIATRGVDVGEWVTTQNVAFTLVGQESLRLRVQIPQEYSSQLKGRQNIAVNVRPDDNGNRTLTARLNRLVNVAEGQSRTLTGLIDLPVGYDWVAGTSARAEIILNNGNENLVWLPKSAIKQHPDGGRSIFAVVNKKAKRHFVSVVRQQGEQVAVKGVPDNLPVVSTGIELLQEGNELKVARVSGERS